MAKKTTSKSHSKQSSLPLPAPAKATRAGQLIFNQLVTLKSDSEFRGHVFARADGTERAEYFISIKEPGQTGKRGCKAFPVDDDVAVTGDEKGDGK